MRNKKKEQIAAKKRHKEQLKKREELNQALKGQLLFYLKNQLF